MMSLVGCSEPEMANVLRGLGYRVHPPSEENGPLHAFSIKPRFVREREEQRERQRQQQQRAARASAAANGPSGRTSGSSSPTRRAPIAASDDAAAQDGPRGDAQAGPAEQSARARTARRADRPRDDRRGPRPPRRDSGGPALRLYATTEKKSDAPPPIRRSPSCSSSKLGGKK